MARANISKQSLKLILRAEFGQDFIDEAARAAGTTKAHARRWVQGKSRVPWELLAEVAKRDPAEAEKRIERHYEASFARVENAKKARLRVLAQAREVLADTLAKAPDAPQALRQRKGGEAPEAPQKRTK